MAEEDWGDEVTKGEEKWLGGTSNVEVKSLQRGVNGEHPSGRRKQVSKPPPPPPPPVKSDSHADVPEHALPPIHSSPSTRIYPRVNDLARGEWRPKVPRLAALSVLLDADGVERRRARLPRDGAPSLVGVEYSRARGGEVDGEAGFGDARGAEDPAAVACGEGVGRHEEGVHLGREY